MSLINQMLTDLEARRGGSVRNVDHALDGLASASGTRRARHGRGLLVAVVLMLGAALAAGLLWKFRLTPAAPPATPMASSASNAPVTTSVPPAPASPAVPPALAPPQAAAATPQPVLLADTRPAPPVEVAPPPLANAAPPPPPEVEPPAATPSLASTSAGAAEARLPPAVTNGLPDSPMAVESPSLTSTPVPPPVAVKQPAKAASATATVPNAPRESPTVEQPGSFHRSPASNGLPPAEAFAYARALKALAEGSTAALSTYVAAHPAQVDARERLALALFEAGRGAEAEVLLRAGLDAAPKSTRFAEMLGHALLGRGDAAGAQAVLRPAAPALAANPEYHALLAAAEQGTASHALAATRYRGLLQLQPGNGRWWVGLGISLRASGDPRQAALAFDRGLDDRSLPEPLRAYAARETVRLKER